jgi:hypothetical protein
MEVKMKPNIMAMKIKFTRHSTIYERLILG